MIRPKLSDIAGIINKKYPFTLAEDWDNVGLQLGDPAAEITRIMVALDPLPQVIDAALSRQCQLLITHHPLIFKPLRQITASNSIGRSLLQSARGGLCLLAMHTNYDIAQDGLNDLLAHRINLGQIRPLRITAHTELAKLVVFVPGDHLIPVRNALFPHTVSIGNYRDCSFATSGAGTFLPLEGSQPAIGTVGNLETVAEERLELLVRRDQLSKAIRSLLAAHPYEEPAFDCYPLLNESASIGLGRFGALPESVTLAEFAESVACKLACNSVRYVGEPFRIVSKIAVCSGSGASLLRDAARSGADVLLTGDIKYHDAREAEDLGVALVDAGHFGTEIIMAEAIRTFLDTALTQAGYSVELLSAEIEFDPFKTIHNTAYGT